MTDRKESWGLAETVACCGLVCGVCKNATPEKGGRVGCARGGGPDVCHQRDCCAEKRLDGCWQCEGFPCEKGFFADAAWKGLCIGSVQCIKEFGLEGYLDRLVSRLGTVVEYGEYRHKTPQEIRKALCADAAP